MGKKDQKRSVASFHQKWASGGLPPVGSFRKVAENLRSFEHFLEKLMGWK